MPNTSERPTDDTEAIVYTYGNTLYRLCLVMLGSAADAEDALQETFLRYFRSAPQFNNSDHKKAWLITVATNQCKDMLRYRKRHPQIDPDILQTIPLSGMDSTGCELIISGFVGGKKADQPLEITGSWRCELA